MEHFLHPLINWLHLHTQWVGLLAFIVAWLEGIAVIGSLVPTGLIMPAIGGMIGLGIIPVWSTLLLTALGAIAGDNISYCLGYYYQSRITQYWPFTRYPNLLASGQRFFAKRGTSSVFFGRFIGPVRALVPLIAGISHFPKHRFLPINAMACLLWAPLYLAPGLLLASLSKILPHPIAWQLVLYALLLLAAIYLLLYALYHMGLSLEEAWGLQLDRWHKRFGHTRLWQSCCYAQTGCERLQCQRILLTTLLLLLVVGLIASLHSPTLQLSNQVVGHFFYNLRASWLDPIALFLTGSAQSKVTLGFTGIMSLYFLVRRDWVRLAYWLITIALLVIMTLGLKTLVHSSRPGEMTRILHGYSFPSGHVLKAMVSLGFVSIVLQNTPYRNISRWLCLIFTLGVVMSRLYLQAHWASDVLGSLLLGGLLLTLISMTLARHQLKALRAGEYFIICTLAFILLASGYFLVKNKHLHHYLPKITIKTISYEQWWTGHIKPVQRLSRSGQATEQLPIQWQGTLIDIKHSLTQAHWQQVKPADFTSLLAHLSIDKQQLKLPLFRERYQAQVPVLVMVKRTPSKLPTWLVLRLWDSHQRIQPGWLPLWFGNLSYHHAKHPLTRQQIMPLPDPLTQLKTDASEWSIKFLLHQTTRMLLLRKL